MVNKKKTHKRSNLCKRLRSRKKNRKRRIALKKLKKDISNVTDMFKSIDINNVEDALELLVIDTEKEKKIEQL